MNTYAFLILFISQRFQRKYKNKLIDIHDLEIRYQKVQYIFELKICYISEKYRSDKNAFSILQKLEHGVNK